MKIDFRHEEKIFFHSGLFYRFLLHREILEKNVLDCFVIIFGVRFIFEKRCAFTGSIWFELWLSGPLKGELIPYIAVCAKMDEVVITMLRRSREPPSLKDPGNARFASRHKYFGSPNPHIVKINIILC